MASKKGLEHINKLFYLMTRGAGRKSFDLNSDQVKIIAGGNGSLTAVMKIKDEHANQGGFLHGGMTAFLVDEISGLALLTYPNITSTGVSVNMNIEYTRPCPVGEEILIKATTEKIGKRLAFLAVNIFNRGTGQLVAKGTHIKFM